MSVSSRAGQTNRQHVARAYEQCYGYVDGCGRPWKCQALLNNGRPDGVTHDDGDLCCLFMLMGLMMVLSAVCLCVR